MVSLRRPAEHWGSDHGIRIKHVESIQISCKSGKLGCICI